MSTHARKKTEPRSSQSSEVTQFRDGAKNLVKDSDKIVDLRRRLRKIGRDAGMEVTETGAFPVFVPAGAAKP